MNPESIVEMGMASRGKYTLLKMLELVVNVPETLLMEEKKVHTAVRQIEQRLRHTAVDRLAIVPNITVYMAMDSSGVN